MNPEKITEIGELESRMQWFRTKSLEALRINLARIVYPSYPDNTERLWADGKFEAFEPLVLPYGPWETSLGVTPTIPEREEFIEKRFRLDAYGRPLHPWVDDMLEDPEIGVLTGKGFYWSWGPNYTADSIVIRHDLDEPHLLLIERKDTGQWALPGGFINDGEDQLSAAIRETQEETGLYLEQFNPLVTPVYNGPLADIRITANAWAETTAFRFDLTNETAKLYAEFIDGGDDAARAAWRPISSIDKQLFGSHGLLVKLALDQSF